VQDNKEKKGQAEEEDQEEANLILANFYRDEVLQVKGNSLKIMINNKPTHVDESHRTR
jgi:hypothetical protein